MHGMRIGCTGQSGMRLEQVRGTVGVLGILVTVLLCVAISPSLAAPEPKVEICHMPPENPGNMKTIIISAHALSAHLAHGDSAGPCQTPNPCMTVCDDNNLCTADASTWTATTSRCDCTHTPVDCDDGNACTADGCTPAQGCVYTAVGSGALCDDGDACTLGDQCDGEGGCLGTSIAGCCRTDAHCHDGDACTIDTCSDGECVHTEDAGNPSCNAGTCLPGVPACSDGCDNDNDGRVDGDDVECTGALDNDESSFSTGIPGDNLDTVFQDCFFDGNSGVSPNEDCEIHVCCLLGAPDQASCPIGAAQYNPSECSQPQSTTCQNYCEALTPTGCDCFGCCTMCDPASNTCFDIIINPATAPQCDETAISDPAKCPRCVKTASCQSPCDIDLCVLCPGQDPSDLPITCGGSPACPRGKEECQVSAPCPAGKYCANNCCVDGIP